jgi:hypothetical protein
MTPEEREEDDRRVVDETLDLDEERISFHRAKAEVNGSSRSWRSGAAGSLRGSPFSGV